ncbi:thioredoxin M5, chloroplastic-like [Benincasa hispida]|uniref:thioredoxin M5, chloroplastic-like n=1 Tax=Benincasa hispida TaxID=102211 RepID=UPI001900FB77|nr:thioredoxin M5, chloroplastic-like [Benincasa hispida]
MALYDRLKMFISVGATRQIEDIHPFKELTLLKFSSPSSSTFKKSFSVTCQARGAVDDMKEVTVSSWNNLVVKNQKDVLVEFRAPWCGPCKIIEPVIKELAAEDVGMIVCLKLIIDVSPNMASKYGIRILTILFFRNGEQRESVIGVVPKSILVATNDNYVEV